MAATSRNATSASGNQSGPRGTIRILPARACRKGRAHGALLQGFLYAMAALPIVAFAQVTQTGEYLSKMDTDGDGRVSLAEYQDWMGYAFDGMDRDGDGVLAPHELPGGKGPAVTREAHRARLAERFGKQDANRDGFLDARELAAPPR